MLFITLEHPVKKVVAKFYTPTAPLKGDIIKGPKGERWLVEARLFTVTELSASGVLRANDLVLIVSEL